MSGTTPHDSTSAQGGSKPHGDGNGTDAPEQRQATPAAVIGSLPPEIQQAMPATLVQGLDTAEQKKAAATAVIGSLPSDVQQQLANTVLGSPDRKTRQILWYLVVSTLTAAVFVFGTMAFVLVYQKKAAEAPLALATAALGGIIGLVATSPGSRNSDLPHTAVRRGLLGAGDLIMVHGEVNDRAGLVRPR